MKVKIFGAVELTMVKFIFYLCQNVEIKIDATVATKSTPIINSNGSFQLAIKLPAKATISAPKLGGSEIVDEPI